MKDHSDARLKAVTDHSLHQIYVKFTFVRTPESAPTAVQRKDVVVPLPPRQTTRIIYEYIQVCFANEVSKLFDLYIHSLL